MHEAYLGLGSNLGDRLNFLSRAIQELKALPETTVEQISSVYETEPVGFKDQLDFLNLVVKLKTSLEPARLVKETKRIEQAMGRQNERRWHPREIDIDILLYNNLIFRSQHLFIPHREMTKRKFVLAPLAEVAESVIHPVEKIEIRTLLQHCPDDSKVTKTDYQLAHL